jgi:hypothetical protein
VLLATQSSDHPKLLGRWSYSYAALLIVLAALLGLFPGLSRRGRLPVPAAWMALLVPLAMAGPFVHKRFVEWPGRVAAFEQRRADDPQPGALAAIDVNPLLETVAVHLRDETPPETVLMTDVPRMLQIMSERRCVPFVYRVDPPGVLVGEADLVFYTREIPEAAAGMDTGAPGYEGVFELPAVFDGQRTVTPAVYRPR